MSKMSTRRKLAIASWSAPKEGNIYGKLTIDATNAEAYIEEMRQKSGEKITITHLVGKACAQALKQEPSLNGRITFGRFVPHETVDVAFLVATDGGKDLAKAKVENADQKSVAEIARELRESVERLRAGKDEAFEKSKGPLKMLPTWAIKPIVSLTGYLTGSLGVNMKGLGLEAFPFGSCIVTSVGMLGVDEGFAPPTPWAHVPVYVLVGAIKEQPAVVDGQIVPRPMLTITATIDHRFIDGFQGGTLAKVVREVLENPHILDQK
jgi:pyruvate/2-oxoglutarate dehydrogenase complex dihydrolipoamide acyltransferase (E2) component